MRFRLLLAALLVLVGLAPASAAETSRGLWIWRGTELIQDTAQQQLLAAEAGRVGITDLYLYLPAPAYAAEQAPLAAFIRRMSAAKIAVWGLDGCRCYFSDVEGPKGLYQSVDALIAYNRRVGGKARFVGFQVNNEPQDLPAYPPTFHTGKRTSALSRTGGGVWQKTEAEDREMLLRDWLKTHRAVERRLKKARLKAGAAMVSYTEDYYGEPLDVSFAGTRQSVGRHMMRFVDDYVVMTYNVDPRNAAGRAVAQAAYASTLPAKSRPRVLASIETDKGVARNVSYADTPGKQSKRVALADMRRIARLLQRHAAFAGISIHSWDGWQALPR